MEPLLEPDEPSAVAIERATGGSAFLLLCDHAGKRIPRRLGTLGLPAEELERHIAWDIGAAAVASLLSAALDATLIRQTYSRLVIDCNRPLHSPQSIVRTSERTEVPGNQHVPAEDVARRRREIFEPYHTSIREHLGARRLRGQPTLLVSLHSFTPVFLGQERPWHASVLYHRDDRLAKALGAALRAEPGLVVGDNEPYAVSDETDYAIPEYGERGGLPHVELEIRQDLIADARGQEEWALRLARLLPSLEARLPR